MYTKVKQNNVIRTIIKYKTYKKALFMIFHVLFAISFIVNFSIDNKKINNILDTILIICAVIYCCMVHIINSQINRYKLFNRYTNIV